MKATKLFATVLAALLLSACAKKQDEPLPLAPAAAVNSSNQAAAAIAPKPQFERLTGKWLRPDGGYILEIRSVEPSGKMDVGYFNPKPIHVAKGESSGDGRTMKVFVELRDVNYPGSTYTLTYDPDSDQLAGVYYQAALQQRFDVIFERIK